MQVWLILCNVNAISSGFSKGGRDVKKIMYTNLGQGWEAYKPLFLFSLLEVIGKLSSLLRNFPSNNTV